MFYLVKTPWLVQKWIYPGYLWSMPAAGKKIYLTFDDGPHPEATPFVLDQLQKFKARASFFCIGKNVLEHPEIFRRITAEGHIAGNHTHNHLNGWKVDQRAYLANTLQAAGCISTTLFRPPYGKITSKQAAMLKEKLNYTIVMWSVLSGDFDEGLSREACYKNVINSTRAGSIIVFHDSDKALPKLRYALPLVLEYFSARGYNFEKLPG